MTTSRTIPELTCPPGYPIDVEDEQQDAAANPRFFYLYALLFWTLLSVTFSAFITTLVIQSYNSILYHEISSAAQRDILFRAWNSRHGGVYIPLNDEVEPNKYLRHPKRDVTTNFGDRLTLVNPAWMTRQISEMQISDGENAYSTLTSSRLLNPANAPDEWESATLDLMESGQIPEHTEIVKTADSGWIVRYMKALPIQKGCLNCHAEQGYQVGDIRGVISTRMPAGGLLSQRNIILFVANICCAIAWGLGVLGLTFFRYRLTKYHAVKERALNRLRENEQVLSRHRDHLEELVAERTWELQIKTEDAEKANAAKTLFLAHMSHEIRTPLNGVICLSQLMNGTDLSAKQEEYVKLITLSGETLLSLVNDILDFSKIEAGKLELNYHDFNLLDKLQATLGILSTRKQGNKLELCLDIDPRIPRIVNGDAGRLLQILINFAGNSIKFTNEGGVRISAVLQRHDEFSTNVLFQISDTGIGIEPEKIQRLFESYTQADAETAGLYGGTGLGLPIAKSLVELMGGSVNVESRPGVGTTFRFDIPFGKASTSPPIEGSFKKMIDSLPSLKGIRVLLVDDNAVLCESMSDQLRFWEMNPVVSHTTRDAKAILASGGAELLIVDVDIGDEKGADFIESVRKESLPAILLYSASKTPYDNGAAPEKVVPLKKNAGISAFYDAILLSLFGNRIDNYIRKKNEQEENRYYRIGDRDDCRILVAEDNMVNQIVISELLHTNGYDCDIVADGSKAIAAARTGKYALVLMDCQMPEMDGLEATRKIREEEAEAENVRPLPIVALTANATKMDRQLTLQAGMDDYCSKPINPDSLFRIIEKHLKKVGS